MKVRIFWCQTRAAPVALWVSLGVIKIVAVGVRVLGRAFSGCVGLPGPPKGHKPVPILEPPRLADAKNKFN